MVVILLDVLVLRYLVNSGMACVVFEEMLRACGLGDEKC